MPDLTDLDQRISAIEARNQRVELEKKGESRAEDLDHFDYVRSYVALHVGYSHRKSLA
jgi:hypothetical protein